MKIDASPSVTLEQIDKKLQNISEVLLKFQPELLGMERSLTRIEKFLNLNSSALPAASTTLNIEQGEVPNNRDEVIVPTNVKDEITYALMSCVSFYVLYRIFFS